MIVLIGGRGRLGQALSALYSGHEVVSLKRELYQDWWKDGATDDVRRFFGPYLDERAVVFVTAGLLDPRLPPEEHWKVNYLLPKHVVDGATALGARVVTFGTVMEKLISRKNPYVRSKAALGEYVAGLNGKNGRATHVRVHTLFGAGLPSPFMFLGQIHYALTNNTVFEMSPGNQLREYHHLDDEVRAIRALVAAGVSGTIDLSHGEAVSLKDIASYVFASFGAESLLRIGALPEPSEENYASIFERPELLKTISFRKTLPAIVTYLQGLSHNMESMT